MNSDTKEQFFAAYNKYADALFRHCFFKVYNRELAKDLIQETFCRTWTYLSQGKEIDNIRAFLYRLLHNVIVDEIRKKKAFSLDKLSDDGFSFKDESAPDMELAMEFKNIINKLKLLDESHRDIIRLRFIEDLPLKEIATILDISENAVSVRLHRSLNKLRQFIKEE